MAIAFVQAAKGASSGAVASQGVTIAAPTAGNKLLVFVACSSTGATFTVACTNCTFNATADKIQTSSAGDAHWFQSTAVNAAAGTTVTATISSGTAFLTVVAYEFSGLTAGSAAFDKSSGASNVTGTGGASLAAGTTAATAQADELVLGGWLFNNGNAITFTPGAGFTAPAGGQELSGNVDLCALTEYKIVAATGTQAATGTTTDSTGQWAGALATYTMAAAGGGGGRVRPAIIGGRVTGVDNSAFAIWG